MRRYFLILGIFALTTFSLSAQSSRMKRANKAFENLNYQEAIELYSEVLGKEDNTHAKMNLAECYRKVNNTEEAEYWLGQIVNMPESEAVHKLYYGMMLQTNGKCDLAREWFIKYVEEVPDDLRGQYLVRACDYEEELLTKNEGVYEIENMPFNTALDDFSPMFYGEGIVFSSEYKDAGRPIKREHTWTGNPFLELFFVERTETRKRKETVYEYGDAKPFSNRLNSKYHDAAVSFNADQTQIFFTRNNYLSGKTGRDDDGAIRLKIYSAESQGEGYAWVNLEGLPFNSDEYSVAHPALNEDGTKLYFASDMPGGFGGMDLYVTDLDNGRWGPPSNLGPGINTEGHEVFPYVSNAQLYFVSNGHVGLGGLDIYGMQIKDNGEYGNIINLGFPINSTSDDFGIVMNEKGDMGYFSSDREGGFGKDDIYSFKKSAAKVRLLVIDEESGQGIPNAEVISEITGNTYTTNAAGIVELEQKLNECNNFTASAQEYIENSQEGCTKDLKEDEEGIIVEIPLKRHIEFDLFGIVFDQNTNQRLSDVKVELIPSGCESGETQVVTTNARGEYSFPEIQKNCCFEVRASKDLTYLATRSSKKCTEGIKQSTSFKQDLFIAPVRPVQTLASTTTNNRPNTVVTSRPVHSTTSNQHVAGTNHSSQGTSTTSHVSGSYTQPSTTAYHSTMTHSSSTYPTSTINGGTFTQSSTTTHSFDQGRTPGTYLLHIYYDFDQSYIRKDAISELEKLYALLADNNKYVVEIGSHTDSRGSFKYNDRLSQRRAESVVRWLKERGIESRRLRPKGYGETVNVNNCKNNVPCSEEEHQWNRRTEFKILGYYDSDGKFVSMVESEKPQHVSVDQCQSCPF